MKSGLDFTASITTVDGDRVMWTDPWTVAGKEAWQRVADHPDLAERHHDRAVVATVRSLQASGAELVSLLPADGWLTGRGDLEEENAPRDVLEQDVRYVLQVTWQPH